ncbi:MAG: hypothetical protein KJO50_08605 [Bacteroidia bacterium]|nr:hypothetical protein [Bacteroidia bacterium]
MSMSLPQTLEELLQYFPEINPPVTLSEDMAVSFSKHNRPIPISIVDKVFNAWDSLDEYTELVPCFQIDTEDHLYTLVYWKASLMTHEFILVNLDAQGVLISKKVIAGTISDGDRVIRSVARIDEDNCIYVTVGEVQNPDQSYNSASSKAYRFEILPDGEISGNQEEIIWEEKEERKQAQKN